VFSPCPALISVGSHKNSGIVNDIAHAGRRTGRDAPNCF
jgi:hypothetical protein